MVREYFNRRKFQTSEVTPSHHSARSADWWGLARTRLQRRRPWPRACHVPPPILCSSRNKLPQAFPTRSFMVFHVSSPPFLELEFLSQTPFCSPPALLTLSPFWGDPRTLQVTAKLPCLQEVCALAASFLLLCPLHPRHRPRIPFLTCHCNLHCSISVSPSKLRVSWRQDSHLPCPFSCSFLHGAQSYLILEGA